MTTTRSTRIAAIAALTALSGCVSDAGTPEPRFSDNIAPPAGMEAACIAQATALTGAPPAAVIVTNRIETGGGPFIGLNIEGASYGCRREPDGSVTVFSQFAN